MLNKKTDHMKMAARTEKQPPKCPSGSTTGFVRKHHVVPNEGAFRKNGF